MFLFTCVHVMSRPGVAMPTQTRTYLLTVQFNGFALRSVGTLPVWTTRACNAIGSRVAVVAARAER